MTGLHAALVAGVGVREGVMGERPLRSRVWFWKPSWYWYGWSTLLPFYRGGDEFNWHTLVFGWTVTGRMIFAYRPCDGTGKCAGDLADPEITPDMILATEWPVDAYGHNHVECHNPDCYCREDAGDLSDAGGRVEP